jgi:osmotically-inducible protein OsmY
MKRNEDLQKDVQDAIKWEPLLNAAEIGVIAKDGIVTLTGTVDSYAKKLEAEDAAKNVAGVKALVEKIEIKMESSAKNGDTEIAKDVLDSFKWNWEIPKDKVKVKVEKGWVTLEGELGWNYQKEAAKRSVNNIIGVKAVTNKITIKSETHDEIEKKDIEYALVRNSSLDSEDISVKVSGNNVTLKGIVHSFYERGEAERIAWNAPGVWTVDNELVIEYN